MHDQKSLMLRWRSFLGGGSDIGSGIVAHGGHLCIDYGSTVMHSTLSVHDARPKIVDAPLMLIIMRW